MFSWWTEYMCAWAYEGALSSDVREARAHLGATDAYADLNLASPVPDCRF